MKNRMVRSFAVVLAVLFGIGGSRFASAQSFKAVKVQGGFTLTQISAGGASVWALASNGHPYLFKGTQFVLATSAVSLSQISAGGGSVRQADTVWALDSSGNIYHAAKSGTTWTFSPVPGTGFFTQIAAGAGYHDSCHPYEVWGLNSNAQIFRYNFCSGNFDTIAGILCSLSVGGGKVWGTDCGGNVYYYSFFSGGFQQMAFVLAQLAVGADSVWGIDGGGNLVILDPISGGYAGPVNQVAAGSGVWFIDTSNRIFHLDGNYTQIPGPTLTSIKVGEGGGVWGLDGSGKAYAFSTP